MKDAEHFQIKLSCSNLPTGVSILTFLGARTVLPEAEEINE
jgi:hypothetical protein